jgi:glycosyltransferase involved in cell wall biosynthesis
MSFLEHISVLILTYNEAPNIGRTLGKLTWAKSIVVIDSGSTDETVEILRRYPQVEILHRPFDDFASQCNFGLSQIGTEWVLSLDADYELSSALCAELKEFNPGDDLCGFQARFIYRVYGRVLRATLYPPRTVLFRKNRATYRNEGHGHRVCVDGPLGWFAATIYHDDRKPLSRWFVSQQSYARTEADYLLSSHIYTLPGRDRIRLMAWPAPILVFLYTLLVKGCILDGWPGWLYVIQRSLAEMMLALEIIDRRLRSEAVAC